MQNEFPRLKIGVSECLLGMKVRFDGGHKKDKFLVNFLSEYCDYVPICPEVAIGMGVPRPPIHLSGDPNNPQVVGVKDISLNVTKALKKYSKEMAASLSDISGYILKKDSPTCGMERVRVYNQNHQAVRTGVGVFANALMQAQPYLPIEEEGRLNDPVLRDNFIERMYAYRRWQDLINSGVTMQKLVAFHTIHKFTLLAHNATRYKTLGQIIANPQRLSAKQVSKHYIEEFTKAMQTRANAKKHTNVLLHLMGFLKKDLSAGDKQELLEVIEQFRLRRVPLVVPLTLLKHHLRHHPEKYVCEQVYLNPHPAELMLRNFI